MRNLSPSLDHLQIRGKWDSGVLIGALVFAADADFNMPLSLPSKEVDGFFFSSDVMSSISGGFWESENPRGADANDVGAAGTGARTPMRSNSSEGMWTVRGVSFPLAAIFGVPIRRERTTDVCASMR